MYKIQVLTFYYYSLCNVKSFSFPLFPRIIYTHTGTNSVLFKKCLLRNSFLFLDYGLEHKKTFIVPVHIPFNM